MRYTPLPLHTLEMKGLKALRIALKNSNGKERLIKYLRLCTASQCLGSAKKVGHRLQVQMLVHAACPLLIQKVTRLANTDIRKKERYVLQGMDFTNTQFRRSRAARRRSLSGRVAECKQRYLEEADRTLLQRCGVNVPEGTYASRNLGLVEIVSRMEDALRSGNPSIQSSCLAFVEPYFNRDYDRDGVIYPPPTCCQLVLRLATEVWKMEKLMVKLIGSIRGAHAACLLVLRKSIVCRLAFVPFSENVLRRLVAYIYCNRVECEALFVIGNIVRWGAIEQLQFLVAECNIIAAIAWELEGRRFPSEACQILSVLAAASEVEIKSLYMEADVEAAVIQPLCNLLMGNRGDALKVEAAYSHLYVYGFLF